MNKHFAQNKKLRMLASGNKVFKINVVVNIIAKQKMNNYQLTELNL